MPSSATTRRNPLAAIGDYISNLMNPKVSTLAESVEEANAKLPEGYRFTALPNGTMHLIEPHGSVVGEFSPDLQEGIHSRHTARAVWPDGQVYRTAVFDNLADAQPFAEEWLQGCVSKTCKQEARIAQHGMPTADALVSPESSPLPPNVSWQQIGDSGRWSLTHEVTKETLGMIDLNRGVAVYRDDSPCARFIDPRYGVDGAVRDMEAAVYGDLFRTAADSELSRTDYLKTLEYLGVKGHIEPAQGMPDGYVWDIGVVGVNMRLLDPQGATICAVDLANKEVRWPFRLNDTVRLGAAQEFDGTVMDAMSLAARRLVTELGLVPSKGEPAPAMPVTVPEPSLPEGWRSTTFADGSIVLQDPDGRTAAGFDAYTSMSHVTPDAADIVQWFAESDPSSFLQRATESIAACIEESTPQLSVEEILMGTREAPAPEPEPEQERDQLDAQPTPSDSDERL